MCVHVVGCVATVRADVLCGCAGGASQAARSCTCPYSYAALRDSSPLARPCRAVVHASSTSRRAYPVGEGGVQLIIPSYVQSSCNSTWLFEWGSSGLRGKFASGGDMPVEAPLTACVVS